MAAIVAAWQKLPLHRLRCVQRSPSHPGDRRSTPAVGEPSALPKSEPVIFPPSFGEFRLSDRFFLLGLHLISSSLPRCYRNHRRAPKHHHHRPNAIAPPFSLPCHQRTPSVSPIALLVVRWVRHRRAPASHTTAGVRGTVTSVGAHPHRAKWSGRLGQGPIALFGWLRVAGRCGRAFFSNFVFHLKIPRNSFKVLKFIENRIHIIKIQNKFL
jgi:hypothetical protein